MKPHASLSSLNSLRGRHTHGEDGVGHRFGRGREIGGEPILQKPNAAGHGESRPAKRIETASILGCISLETAQNEMHGGQAIPAFDFYLAPYVRNSFIEEVPLMADYQPAEGEVPTNAQLYRIYIERYLCSLPVVNQEMDLIISQKEPTTYGVPIQVYFFSRNKVWKEYERIQSDIFDHLLVMVQKFDLKLYQYSD